jgi:hypothetical protein
MLDKIVKYFSVISIAIFFLSYAYLDGYYSSFNINIINYINTSEVFYVLLPLVALFLSAGYSLFQGYIAPGTRKRTEKVQDELLNPQKTPWYERQWVLLVTGVLGLSVLFINIKLFPNRAVPAIQVLGFLLLFLGVGYSATKNAIKEYGFYPFLKFTCFVLVGYLFITYGKQLASVNKVLGNSHNIKFNFHGKTIKTDSSTILAGETQSVIFIYNKADSNTWVIPRTNIDSLIILSK